MHTKDMKNDKTKLPTSSIFSTPKKSYFRRKTKINDISNS